MSSREKVIAQSIVHAIHNPDSKAHHSVFGRLPKYFSTHWLDFDRVDEEVFKQLRMEWHIKEEDYLSSFSAEKDDVESILESMGDMGFSGSTFYTTADSTYLVKSVPRQFEHSFFKDDLLKPYAEHMHKNLASLLVRITDFLENSQGTFGTTVGLAPSHHIIMENIRYGQDQHEDKEDTKWESYDLKPLSYFYPERDVANGAFATEEAMSKLADEFKDKLVLTLDDAEEFKAQLDKDTALLARCNAVDYSLYLVRIPAVAAEGKDKAPLPPPEPPFAPPGPPSWRTGMKSADGKWFYRAAILDFFWAKHKTTAKLMTGLIKSYNVVDNQGPMSITTDAKEYRQRFLDMCKDMIEVKNDDSGSKS